MCIQCHVTIPVLPGYFLQGRRLQKGRGYHLTHSPSPVPLPFSDRKQRSSEACGSLCTIETAGLVGVFAATPMILFSDTFSTWTDFDPWWLLYITIGSSAGIAGQFNNDHNYSGT
jgi:hypothetical protein